MATEKAKEAVIENSPESRPFIWGDLSSADAFFSSCLHLDGLRQMQGAAHLLADDYFLPVLHIARQHSSLQPLESPGVFHSDNRVGPWDDARKHERAVEIGLVAAK